MPNSHCFRSEISHVKIYAARPPSVGTAFHVCLTLPFGLLGCLGSATLIADFAAAISSSKCSLVAGRKLSGSQTGKCVRRNCVGRLSVRPMRSSAGLLDCSRRIVNGRRGLGPARPGERGQEKACSESPPEIGGAAMFLLPSCIPCTISRWPEALSLSINYLI